MIYGGDLAMQMPIMDLYDKQIMAMSINAARDMYEKGQKQIDDFYSKYGDFMSPIQKDMDWYNQNVTSRVKDTINNLYAQGIDPLRSAEGRAAVAQLIYSMPTGDIAKVRQSAETAKEYVKNYGKLAAAGLLNEDAEKNYFERDLTTWDTINGNGVWGASSPMENKTIDDIIEPIIKHLDYTYDPNRTKQANDGNDYYTVTEDRIRQTIADAMPDLMTNKTMGGYYYNKALQATGDPDKAKALYTEWLVDRGKDHLKEKKEVNPYKMLAAKTSAERQNILLQDRLARERDANKFRYQIALKGMAGRTNANGGSKYGSLTGAAYNLPEEVHHDGLYTAITNQAIPVYKLTDDGRGNLVPVKKNGQLVQINPDDATWEELEYAANNKSALVSKQEEFAKKQAGNRPYSFIFDANVQNNYLNKYGYHINALEVGSLFPTKKIDKDGSIILSTTDIKNLKKMQGIIADSMGSRAKYSKEKNLSDVLPKDQSGWIGSSNYVKEQLDNGGRVQASFVFDDSSEKNILQLVGDDGESQIWVKGNVTYITGAPAGKQTPMSTVEEVWLPTNIKSNKALYQKFSSSTPWKSNFGLNSKYRSAYDAMAAHYAKATGSQKNTNVALNGTSFDDDEPQWPLFFNQE